MTAWGCGAERDFTAQVRTDTPRSLLGGRLTLGMALVGGIKCVKYVMFAFNLLFWVGGVHFCSSLSLCPVWARRCASERETEKGLHLCSSACHLGHTEEAQINNQQQPQLAHTTLDHWQKHLLTLWLNSWQKFRIHWPGSSWDISQQVRRKQQQNKVVVYNFDGFMKHDCFPQILSQCLSRLLSTK